MSTAINIQGARFGRLTAVAPTEQRQAKSVVWKCKCDCGGVAFVSVSSLRSGGVKSCGCLMRGNRGKTATHGKSQTRVYRIWNAMKTRCNNPHCAAYENYGGRGITVCEEWQHNFKAFYDWAMANSYQNSLSIDRINNNKGYSPHNCRWATSTEQNNNRRTQEKKPLTSHADQSNDVKSL